MDHEPRIPHTYNHRGASESAPEDAVRIITSLDGFRNYFEQLSDQHSGERAAFLLGAGASIECGIPSGGLMVADWLFDLYLENNRQGAVRKRTEGKDFDPDTRAVLLAWAQRHEALVGITSQNLGAYYSTVYKLRFGDRPRQGQKYLEKAVRGCRPRRGYYFLAALIGQTRHNIILTTNFDNLVINAVCEVCDHHPLIISHESLAPYLDHNEKGPIIAKLHHDVRLSPRSAPEDLRQLGSEMASRVTTIARERTLIVIGYAGADDNVMSCLEEAAATAAPRPIYWFYYLPDGLPAPRVRQLVAYTGGAVIPHQGFERDDLIPRMFLALQRNLTGYENLKSPRTALEDRNRHQLALLSEEVIESPSALPEPEKTGADRPDQASADADRSRPGPGLPADVPVRQADWKPWDWIAVARSKSDVREKEDTYRAGLAAYPDSSDLHAAYGSLLMVEEKNWPEAQQHFAQAERDPALSNYARIWIANFADKVGDSEERVRSHLEDIATSPSVEPKILTAALQIANLESSRVELLVAIAKRILEHPDSEMHALETAAQCLTKHNVGGEMIRPLLERIRDHTRRAGQPMVQAASIAFTALGDPGLVRALLERLLDFPGAEPIPLYKAASEAIHRLNDSELAAKLLDRLATHPQPTHSSLVGGAEVAQSLLKDDTLALRLLVRLRDMSDASPTSLVSAAGRAAKIAGQGKLTAELIEALMKHHPTATSNLASAAKLASESLAQHDLVARIVGLVLQAPARTVDCMLKTLEAVAPFPDLIPSVIKATLETLGADSASPQDLLRLARKVVKMPFEDKKLARSAIEHCLKHKDDKPGQVLEAFKLAQAPLNDGGLGQLAIRRLLASDTAGPNLLREVAGLCDEWKKVKGLKPELEQRAREQEIRLNGKESPTNGVALDAIR